MYLMEMLGDTQKISSLPKDSAFDRRSHNYNTHHTKSEDYKIYID